MRAARISLISLVALIDGGLMIFADCVKAEPSSNSHLNGIDSVLHVKTDILDSQTPSVTAPKLGGLRQDKLGLLTWL